MKSSERISSELISGYLEILIRKEEIIGVCLLGGLSKGRFDEFSDIDLGILLTRPPTENYLPPFSFFLSSHNIMFEFNISQMILPNELESKWEMSKIEAYSSSVILYDKDGQLQSLIRAKSSLGINFYKDRLIEFLGQYYWRVQRHLNVSHLRGYELSALLLYHDGLRLIIESLFALNERPVPHTKWIECELGVLALRPSNLLTILAEGGFGDLLGYGDIVRRVRSLDQIYDWLCIECNVKYGTPRESHYQYWASNIGKRQLISPSFSELFAQYFSNFLPEIEIESIKGIIAFNLYSSVNDIIDNLSSFRLKRNTRRLILENESGFKRHCSKYT